MSNHRDAGNLGVPISNETCDDVNRGGDVVGEMDVNKIADSWGCDFGPMNKDAVNLPESEEPEHAMSGETY